MSSVTTKNPDLSTYRPAQPINTPTTVLSYTSTETETHTEVKIEVPGVDPSTVEVNFESNNVFVKCSRGTMYVPVDPTVDVSKIKADIQWGLLTLIIPAPVAPAPRGIKVNVLDAVKSVSTKSTAKFTSED